MLRIGPFEVHSIQTGTFRLDGGAMFGVVPKVLWQSAVDVDDQNRIALATRTLLVVDRAARRVILADTGCGTKWTPQAAARFAIRHDADAIDRALEAVGMCRGDVTDVIVTHLHFDHNGGLTDWAGEPGGPTVLRYPRARHWIHRRQWEHTHKPTPKDRASYLPEDFAGLADSGLLTLVEGDKLPALTDGLELFLSHGHTPYQLHPLVRGPDAAAIFVGDMIPTVAHLRPTWVMAYDLHPLTTIDEKCHVLRLALENGWTILCPHDPQIAGVRLDGTVERPVVSETPDVYVART